MVAVSFMLKLLTPPSFMEEAEAIYWNILIQHDSSLTLPFYSLLQTKLAVLAAVVASASAFAPARPAFYSTALANQKADWEKAAELGWSMGGEDYTRAVPDKLEHEDTRKSIHEAPSFEEYMKQRQQG